MTDSSIILASSSQTRVDMLTRAGISVTSVPPRVDEATVKAAILQDGHGPENVADALAEMKATKISAKSPGRLVLGADQVLEFEGKVFDKPLSLDQVAEHLRLFSAKSHRLISAAVIAENGRPVFRARQIVTLHVRPLSEEFIKQYVKTAPPSILECVGGYQLEGLGAQLFYRIEGDYFAVLGLPLLDILGYLRERGVLVS